MTTPLKSQRSRASKKHARRSPGPRNTPAQKERILELFYEKSLAGIPVAVTASSLGVSLASIYRWGRDATLAQQAADYRTFAYTQPVGEAIEILSTAAEYDLIVYRQAVLAFSVWLRWPTRIDYNHFGVSACSISYLQQSTGAESLSQLDPSEQLAIAQCLRLDVLKRLYTFQPVDLPFFASDNLEFSSYTESDVAVDIVRYFLAHAAQEHRSNSSPSLGKAFFLLSESGFEYRFPFSYRTFCKLWAAKGLAAPFLYVENFHSKLSWRLDPLADIFAKDVDELLNNRDEVRQYFSRCRWVVESFKPLLDPRAAKSVTFPAFPANLHSEPVEVARLTPEMKVTLTGYRSAAI